jgi:MAE_28990/MAE_18760-like HEPN
MSTDDFVAFFEERFREIETYLELLEEIDRAAQSGAPRLQGTSYKISIPQQKILYSSFYLQLYNLVEATVSRCINATTKAAALSGSWQPHQLNESLFKEWVRSIAGTHTIMSPEKRLEYALGLSSRIVDRLPLQDFSIDVGGGGNWDDDAIYKLVVRLGCSLKVKQETFALVKAPMRDRLGALKLIKDRRNGLAHGSISFIDCADGVAVIELRAMAAGVEKYLREVVESFSNYIQSHEFLRPDSRPAGGAP